MLKITFSEKGGAERDLYFDGNEVTIGRVQGNSIVLPKPNVSKRHATLMLDEAGRITIVDQNSTNGTYVNGRRITSPKDLGPDDRVYIGDFTIRAEEAESQGEGSAPLPMPSDEVLRRPTEAMHSVTDEFSASQPSMPPIPNDASGVTPVPLDLEVEVDPDEESVLSPPPPPPPPAEHDTRPPIAMGAAAVPLDIEVEVPESDWAPPAAEPASPEPAPAPDRGAALTEPVPVPLEVPASAPRPVHHATGLTRRASASQPVLTAGDAHQDALRTAAQEAAVTVFAYVDPVQSEFEDTEWQTLSDQVMRMVDRLRRENRIPAGVDPYGLTQEILFEFTGLGVLEELLADEGVRAILVDGADRLHVRRGGETARLPRAFASEETYGRVAAKLMALSGFPQEMMAEPRLEGRLPDGTNLLVLNPPVVVEGRVLVLERPQATTLSMGDLVAHGLATQEQVDRMAAAIRAHRNVAVCGTPRTARTAIQNVLLAQLAETDRVVVLEDRRELVPERPGVVRIARQAATGLSGSLSRMAPDTIALPELEAGDLPVLQGLVLAGQKGLLYACLGTSAAGCLRHLELLLALANPALGELPARTLARELAEIIVVLAEGPDGRTRVADVVEGGPAE